MPEADRPGRRKRVRAATRANALFIALAVVAVAYPLFFHYVGFARVQDLGGLTYPRLVGYRLQETPDQRPSHGLAFGRVHRSARRLADGEPVYSAVPRGKSSGAWLSSSHPLVHWLYLPTLALPFALALPLHNLGGIALVLLCAALALRRGGALAAFPSLAGAVLAAMFLSPTGLLHLERGQVDTFVAASFVCTVAMFERRMLGWALGAALLSTFRVSAWVFVGSYWLVAAPLWGLRDRRVWLLPGVVLLVNLVFVGVLGDWIAALSYSVEGASTAGPSFTKILPNFAAFALPFASTFVVGAAVFLSLRLHGRLSDVAFRRDFLARISFPFAALLAVQTVCATPVTHDYRLVALLGLLPLLATWCARGESIPVGLRYAVALGYSALLVAAFRIPPFLETYYQDMAWLLLAGSGVFFAVTLYLVFPSRLLPSIAERRSQASYAHSR